ncbi:MAG: hypothetical protein WCI76_02730 [bacterium]
MVYALCLMVLGGVFIYGVVLILEAIGGQGATKITSTNNTVQVVTGYEPTASTNLSGLHWTSSGNVASVIRRYSDGRVAPLFDPVGVILATNEVVLGANAFGTPSSAQVFYGYFTKRDSDRWIVVPADMMEDSPGLPNVRMPATMIFFFDHWSGERK